MTVLLTCVAWLRKCRFSYYWGFRVVEFCQYICGNIDNYSIIIYNTRNFFKYFSQRHLLQPLMVPVNLHCRYVAQILLNKIIMQCIFSFLFIGRELTMWPANNCLQIMVCSCVVSSKCVLLQIIFCSCVIELWWQITSLCCQEEIEQIW